VSVFSWPARVYWEDTDGGAIVYYANYLRFLERSRTEWLRAHGHSQLELARAPGILFTVVSIQIDYRAPARLDDELAITCEPRAEGAASLRFAQRIYRTAPDGAERAGLLVEAQVRIACVDAGSLRPRRLPQFLREAVAAEATANG
jgi:acyl-CoA thioester hydrolase